MTAVRVLPAQTPRVETGPVRFGDDWTGVFIRGDNAFAYLLALGIAADQVNDVIQAEMLRSLRRELAACIEGPMGAEVRATL